MCGGTDVATHTVASGGGLSPRVRGNPRAGIPAVPGERSIPACAGEPGIPDCRAGGGRVYPRVCGGTLYKMLAQSGGMGLSPRVRGNQ